MALEKIDGIAGAYVNSGITIHLVKAGELDRETIAMIQRASPLPAPPAEVQGTRITLTVPVRFDID